MLGGLLSETPLGRIVEIRAENDQSAVKNMSREQRQIRDEWRNKRAKSVSRVDYDRAMKEFSAMFRSIGGVKNGQ